MAPFLIGQGTAETLEILPVLIGIGISGMSNIEEEKKRRVLSRGISAMITIMEASPVVATTDKIIGGQHPHQQAGRNQWEEQPT